MEKGRWEKKVRGFVDWLDKEEMGFEEIEENLGEE